MYLFPGWLRIKPALIEISIYSLKVLVRRRRREVGLKKRKERLYFLLEISHTHIRCGVAHSELPGMKYDFMFSMCFQEEPLGRALAE